MAATVKRLAEIFDVLILGGGPAGLEAALCLARHLKTAVVFSDGTFRNGISKHMHMVPTWDHRDSKDFRAAVRQELAARYETISFADVHVDSISKTDDSTLFVATDVNGKAWSGRRVLLAHGVKDIMPEETFPGYTACWGRGLYHCLYCHGFEERGASSVGVLAWGVVTPGHAREVARQARNLATKVIVYTQGNKKMEEELRAIGLGKRIEIDGRKIVRLESIPSARYEGSEIMLHLEDGTSVHQGFLAHSPWTQLSAPFAEQLGCEIMADKVHIKVGVPFPETTVKGVFAAGDLTSIAPTVINSLQGGQMAGVGLVSSLSNVEDETEEDSEEGASPTRHSSHGGKSRIA